MSIIGFFCGISDLQHMFLFSNYISLILIIVPTGNAWAPTDYSSHWLTRQDVSNKEYRLVLEPYTLHSLTTRSCLSGKWSPTPGFLWFLILVTNIECLLSILHYHTKSTANRSILFSIHYTNFLFRYRRIRFPT